MTSREVSTPSRTDDPWLIASDPVPNVYPSVPATLLGPTDGPAGQRPYAVLCRAMRDAGRHALAHAVLSGREQLVLLRPLEDLLVLSVLAYDHQIRRPQVFQDQLTAVKVESEELALAQSLIEASTAKAFDFSSYRDAHAERLERLIEAKLAGDELVDAPPANEPPPVANLIDALRESVARATPPKAPKRRSTNGRPRQKAACRRVGRKRKSS